MPLKTIRLSCELVATIDPTTIRFISEVDVEPESEHETITRRAAELAATIDPKTIHVLDQDERPARFEVLCAAAERKRKREAAKRKARR